MNGTAPTYGFAHGGLLDRDNLRHLSGTLAMLSTVAAISSLFMISPVLLEYFGVSYIVAGGGVLSKFHPGTFLAVIALTLRCAAASHPFQTAWRLVTRDAGVVILLAAVGVAGVFAVIISKTPFTPLGDTFVLPILVLLLLRDLDPRIAKRLALLVACVMAVNAVIAMVEFARQSHMIKLDVADGVTSDPTRGDAVFNWRVQLAQDWRATALLGHPLVNGLITGCFITSLMARGSRWMNWNVKLPLALSQMAAMFAFGARASLVLCLTFSTYLLVSQALAALREGKRLDPKVIAYGLFAIAIVVGAVGLLYASGFFDRTLDRFADDSGSAGTRLTMFELFEPFSWTDLMLGPDPEVVATWQRIYGLEFGIESSWVGLALTYGLVVTSVIMLGLFAFAREVVRACGRGAAAVLLFFFISVSATASLSGKTTTLAMVVALALLFVRKDERQRPLRSLLGIRTG